MIDGFVEWLLTDFYAGVLFGGGLVLLVTFLIDFAEEPVTVRAEDMRPITDDLAAAAAMLKREHHPVGHLLGDIAERALIVEQQLRGIRPARTLRNLWR